MELLLLEWILAIIGSGGLGATITYIFTFKSKNRKIAAEAENSEVEVLQKITDLRLDLYDYLLKTCDKYIKDYHELEAEFRKQISQVREQVESIMLEKSKAISAKCNEIAELKSKVAYLNGIKCYNFTCEHRIKNNPNDL